MVSLVIDMMERPLQRDLSCNRLIMAAQSQLVFSATVTYSNSLECLMREKGQINNETVKMGKFTFLHFFWKHLFTSGVDVYFWDDSLITLICEVEVVLKTAIYSCIYLYSLFCGFVLSTRFVLWSLVQGFD